MDAIPPVMTADKFHVPPIAKLDNCVGRVSNALTVIGVVPVLHI